MNRSKPRWLGWLAVLILIVGGYIAYVLSQQEFNPDAHQQMVVTLAVTAVAAGICLISLTADWWMRH